MSNTEVQIFRFKETAEIRAFMESGKPMFVANDIAKALGYKIPKDAVNRHCKSAVIRQDTNLTNSPRGISVIGEDDVKVLISKSQQSADIRCGLWDTLFIGHKDYIISDRREVTALLVIEQLIGTTLIRQYPVLDYKLDGYDKINKVAYEIDEEGHFKNGFLHTRCEKRQQEIEDFLGCTFVRIKV